MQKNIITFEKAIAKDTRYPDKPQCIAMLRMAFLMFAIFFALISTSQADQLFDFQMTLAKKGNAEAQYKVGEMYETGFGVNKDMTAATEWINKAAAQGHETANFKLLYWDIQKNGMKGDNKAKYEDLLKNAKADNAQAQYYVGKMFAYGVGVKQNYNTGEEWINKAAFAGVLEAERELVALREDKRRAEEQARIAEEKRKAKALAKAEEDKRKNDEARKRLEEKQKQQESLKAEEERKKALEASKTAAAREAAERKAAQERLNAQSQDSKAQELKRQAILKQRDEEEKRRKAEFESDPCSGKSARFLSTCK